MWLIRVRPCNHGGLAKQLIAQVTCPNMSQCLFFWKRRSNTSLQTVWLNGLCWPNACAKTSASVLNSKYQEAVSEGGRRSNWKYKNLPWRRFNFWDNTGLARAGFLFVNHATSVALGRERCWSLNGVTLPGNKWPGSSQSSTWDGVVFPDMPDLFYALNWKVSCKFRNYDSDQDFFQPFYWRASVTMN